MRKEKNEKAQNENIKIRSTIDDSFVFIPENQYEDINRSDGFSKNQNLPENSYDDDFFIYSDKKENSSDKLPEKGMLEKLKDNINNKNIGIVLAAAAVVFLVFAVVLTFSHCPSNGGSSVPATTVQHFSTNIIQTTEPATTAKPSAVTTAPSTAASTAPSSTAEATTERITEAEQVATQGAVNHNYVDIEPFELPDPTEKPVQTEPPVQTVPQTEPPTQYIEPQTEEPPVSTDPPVQEDNVE